SQQIKMTPHRYPFLNDPEVTLEMLGRKRGEETHVVNGIISEWVR
ncbi:hypothetical protein SAMN05216387_1191, partial [Nitrosovibrio tenuis]